MGRLIIEINETDSGVVKEFKNICTFLDLKASDYLIKSMAAFVQSNTPPEYIVDEGTLLKHARSIGLKTNRPLLNKYRKLGILEGTFRVSSSKKIVYYLDKTLNVLKERKGKKRHEENKADTSVSPIS